MSTKPIRQLAALQRDRGALRLRQGLVDASDSAAGTVDLTLGGDDVVVEDVGLIGQAATGQAVWVLQRGGDLVALGALGSADVTDASDMHGSDISTSGPGPDAWPRGICWAAVTSGWTGRPGSSNGVLVSYNAGNFISSHQTYFTGDTLYVRNRASATTWGSWRVAWGPV